MIKIFPYIWAIHKGDLAQLVRVCDSQSQDKGSTPLISTNSLLRTFEMEEFIVTVNKFWFAVLEGAY